MQTEERPPFGIKERLAQYYREQALQLGINLSKEQENRIADSNLIRMVSLCTDFSIERIADMVGVSVSFVEEVKASLVLPLK